MNYIGSDKIKKLIDKLSEWILIKLVINKFIK